MALTEENWSTIWIDPYVNFTGEREFKPEEGDYYRGDRAVHLGHVYKRFRERVQPALVDPQSLEVLLEELALAAGYFATDRPSWIGGQRQADYFLVIGEYMALPVQRKPDRILGGDRYVATTVLVREGVPWPDAYRRGWMPIPPHPGPAPPLVQGFSAQEAAKRAKDHYDQLYPPVPKVKLRAWWPPTPANWRSARLRRRERKDYENTVGQLLHASRTTERRYWESTPESAEQMLTYLRVLDNYRQELASCRAELTE